MTPTDSATPPPTRRVLILTDDPLTRAGLAGVLQGDFLYPSYNRLVY